MSVLIETERLVLREITLDDKEALFRLHADPIVQQYTGEPVVQSVEEIVQAIKGRISNYKRYGFGRWATILKSEQQCVGWAGLAYLPEFDEIDLGYRFLPEYWGLGIATEAARAILQYGFDTLKLEKIIAIAMKENVASINVMKKIGMKFDRLAPYEPGSKDAIWYSCTNKLIARDKSL
ncbi:GNAT family N-acetyltransferase [Aquimarina sp. TRL1]|uniref:GNAT family N-acetyltransferase n=1 Tax=Aquimarina sp. (strain TRL1) TaxID=2736252 RepID=UPI00158A1918|nr:GNAT family N-acetyltransferase [Aquimarina sp. TRL1]QKX06132.1 GNAT family N-acetyltransferase [Aquimarina sp. TRL1]